MSRDLYQEETAESFSQLRGSQVPEPTFWTGFAEGTARITGAGLAKTLRGMDLMQAIPAITKDYFKGGTEEQDKFFALHDWRYNRLIDDLTPGPADVGTAAQVLGGVLGTLPQIILNPPLGVASAVLSTGEDLVREGVPAWQANLVGMTQGATLAAGIRMPILGNNLLTRMLVGGAAANVGLGMANRLISGAILHGEPAAEQFRMFDTTSMFVDTLMGLAFGAYAHMSPAMRAQGGEALKELSDWAQRMKPSEIDALATVRQAQHSNVDSMPGKPLDPTDVEAHVNRLKAAVGQLAREEPVHVEDMPAPRFTPEPEREAGNVQRMNELVKASEEIRQQEGLTEPRLPADLQATDDLRATHESLKSLPREEQAEGVGQVIEAQLRKAGIPEAEALAHGSVWQAFAKTAAEKYGIAPADVLTAKNLSVSRGADRMAGALEQGVPPKAESTFNQDAAPFYSELAKQVDDAPMKSAPAKGWKDWIKGLKGVKADEVKWSGLEEWLDLQEGKVSKEAVQEFLRNNGVKVEEVMLGGADDSMVSAGMRVLIDERGTPQHPGQWRELSDTLEEEARRLLRDEGEEAQASHLLDLSNEAYQYSRGGAPQPGGLTKFSQWQLPGGENYRELLLTLPTKADRAPLSDAEERRLSELTRLSDAGRLETGEQNAEYLDLNERARRAVVGEQFRSSHFDEPNILAHVRFNDRTDAEGKKVLFVEEFQSDWAQQGRKKGFSDDNDRRIGVIKARLEDIESRFDELLMVEDATEREALYAENQQLVRELASIEAGESRGGSVPKAPFVGKTEAWVALSLKRMIRYAAENGYDKISWTRGEQQVERYTQALRKAVDVIEWEKTDKGVRIVGYKGKGYGRLTAVEESRLAELQRIVLRRGLTGHERDEAVRLEGKVERTKVVDTTEKEDILSDAIGKSMAERIRNDPNQKGVIEGENINVNDTGMASFYDRIVPSVAKEVMKKLGGGKVGEVQLGGKYTLKYSDGSTSPRSMAFDEATAEAAEIGTSPNTKVVPVDGASRQPAIEITSEMREKAMAGQPLFQQARAQIHFGEHETIINLFQNANVSSFVHETGHYFLQFLRDLANSPNAPMRAMEDWAAFAKEYKIEGGEITRETHEEFARTWEAYLRNGEAPTPELKRVFQQFRDWLIEIYKSIVELKVKLTPERKALMDSLLTSQRRDPGEPRTAPPEHTDTGSPPPLGEGTAQAGAVPHDTVSVDDIELVTQASGIDAAAVEKAGKDFAEDPAAFINEMRRIVDGEETSQTGGKEEGQKSEGGTEADAQARVLAQEADRFVIEKPDQLIDVGTDAAGNSIQVTAKQYLEEARAAAARAREDIPLFEVAAGCLLGKS